jgi:hypothetical protein
MAGKSKAKEGEKEWRIKIIAPKVIKQTLLTII